MSFLFGRGFVSVHHVAVDIGSFFLSHIHYMKTIPCLEEFGEGLISVVRDLSLIDGTLWEICLCISLLLALYWTGLGWADSRLEFRIDSQMALNITTNA